MADIAFLLLIFFLVATTIIDDRGILVTLPPWDPDPVTTRIPDKNVFSIHLNAQGKIFAESELMQLDILAKAIQDHISNPNASPDRPDNPRKAVISLHHDRDAKYEDYLAIYNEIRRAYNELRESEAQLRFAASYQTLNDQNKKLICDQIPMVVSEAEK